MCERRDRRIRLRYRRGKTSCTCRRISQALTSRLDNLAEKQTQKQRISLQKVTNKMLIRDLIILSLSLIQTGQCFGTAIGIILRSVLSKEVSSSTFINSNAKRSYNYQFPSCGDQRSR